ncbi:Transposon protein, putative, Mutator sub-class [Quillaja saponaria]|uniref:Transposon protein, putative, Mutator sub-class n=1 Tax=Quillaja saponaria TaxID=32244 RepID=A0AAD7Q5G2_QUISA|nr:Transposon protein, putative, Mutator sub-class [Quillaja saponaria]
MNNDYFDQYVDQDETENASTSANISKRHKSSEKGKENVGKEKVAGPSSTSGMQIDEDYKSDDLHSLMRSDDDGARRVRLSRYSSEDICNDIIWKMGMEFTNLTEFKEAITEFSLPNGRRTKFVKNDAVRCRAKCKGNSG